MSPETNQNPLYPKVKEGDVFSSSDNVKITIIRAHEVREHSAIFEQIYFGPPSRLHLSYVEYTFSELSGLMQFAGFLRIEPNTFDKLMMQIKILSKSFNATIANAVAEAKSKQPSNTPQQ